MNDTSETDRRLEGFVAAFHEPRYKDSKIVAFVDVDVAPGITVKGFRVVDGDKGLFAVVPSKPVTVEGQTRYLNQVVFKDPTLKEALLERVLESYRSWEREQSRGRVKA